MYSGSWFSGKRYQPFYIIIRCSIWFSQLLNHSTVIQSKKKKNKIFRLLSKSISNNRYTNLNFSGKYHNYLIFNYLTLRMVPKSPQDVTQSEDVRRCKDGIQLLTRYPIGIPFVFVRLQNLLCCS